MLTPVTLEALPFLIDSLVNEVDPFVWIIRDDSEACLEFPVDVAGRMLRNDPTVAVKEPEVVKVMSPELTVTAVVALVVVLALVAPA
jgi:hypothetical protein